MRNDTAPRTEDSELVALAASLRLVVMRLSRRLRQHADTGITPTLLSALATIDRHGSMTLGELAVHERVQPPTVTRIVARLQDASLVERIADEGDRRVARVRLTAEGRRLIERSRSRKTAYLARRLALLAPEERTTLVRAAAILDRLLEEDRP